MPIGTAATEVTHSSQICLGIIRYVSNIVWRAGACAGAVQLQQLFGVLANVWQQTTLLHVVKPARVRRKTAQSPPCSQSCF